MKRLFHLHQALRCTKIRAERALVQRQIEQLQAKMQRMSSLSTGAECPTCSQPLGESFEMATAHITAEQAKLSERLSELAVVETAKAAPPESVTESQIQVQNIQRAVERPQTKLQELQKCQQLEAKVKSLESEQSSYTVEIRSAAVNSEQLRWPISYLQTEIVISLIVISIDLAGSCLRRSLRSYRGNADCW